MVSFSTHAPWSSGYSRSLFVNKNVHRSTGGTVIAGKEDLMGIVDNATGVGISGRTGVGRSGRKGIGRSGRAIVGGSGRTGVGGSGRTSGASLSYIHQEGSKKR